MKTTIIVYFAVNLVLMMIAVLLNFEQDKDDIRRFFCRCALFFAFGVFVVVIGAFYQLFKAVRQWNEQR